MRQWARRVVSYVDARDVFVAVGFAALYAGIAGRFGHDVALIVLGVIILAKGLTRWV
jgi:hypothetical protein